MIAMTPGSPLRSIVLRQTDPFCGKQILVVSPVRMAYTVPVGQACTAPIGRRRRKNISPGKNVSPFVGYF
jgi:hypothetical protein